MNFSIDQYAPTGTECKSALGIASYTGLSSVSLQVFLWHVYLVPRSSFAEEVGSGIDLFCFILPGFA